MVDVAPAVRGPPAGRAVIAGQRVLVTVLGERVPAVVEEGASALGNVRVRLETPIQDPAGGLDPVSVVYRDPEDCEPANDYSLFVEEFTEVHRTGGESWGPDGHRTWARDHLPTVAAARGGICYPTHDGLRSVRLPLDSRGLRRLARRRARTRFLHHCVAHPLLVLWPSVGRWAHGRWPHDHDDHDDGWGDE